MKVTLEFCADEPEVAEVPDGMVLGSSQLESPLDDVRQMAVKGS